MLYVIGDTHLSFGVNKPMDVFPGWEGYEKRLRENWIEKIGETDTCVIAGDISWAMTLEEVEPDFAFLNNLPGEKIILKGNHDYWWNTMKKMNDFTRDQGFETLHFLQNNSYEVEGVSICGSRSWSFEDGEGENEKIRLRELGRIRMSLEAAICEEKICFLHYPPIFGEQVAEDVIGLLKKFDVKQCFYGHLHGGATRYSYNGIYDGIEFRLISGDYIKFSPYFIK